MPAELLQLFGSLIAIAAIIALVRWLALGESRGFADKHSALQVARDQFGDFEPADIAVDKDGRAALIESSDGRVFLVRPHGAHHAGRVLSKASDAWVSEGAIVIHSGEKRFGDATLSIPDAEHWVQRISAL